jgi:hypothetical protein
VIFKPLKHNDCPSSNGSLRYRDVFTGFVFTNPTKYQYFQGESPGYYDGFEKEYIRRSACLSDEIRKGADIEMKLAKHEKQGILQKHIEFNIENSIELIFYGFSGIGLLIGAFAFLFRPRKDR